MKIILVFGLFPKENLKKIISESKGVIQYAADNLQWSIVEGFSKNNVDFEVVNLPYIGSFPSRYKNPVINDYLFNIGSKLKAQNVGFINVSGYKFYSRYINCKRKLNSIVSETNDDIILLIYALHTPFLRAALKLKEENSNIKIVLVVPDLPEFMGGRNSIIRGIFKKFDNKAVHKMLKSVDGFVILSKHMENPLKIGNRPFVVMEGIYNTSIPHEDFKIEENFTVMYSGTLEKRYGIIRLIQSFIKTKNESYKLWICGDGDGKSDVVDAALKDRRIQYLGQLPNSEVLKLQKRASLLINPRTSDHLFTKFSFPSKTLEYLASGTPTLIYPLEGIPQEYYNFTVNCEDISVAGLSEKIEEVAKLDVNSRKLIGEKAQDFIYNYKNPQIQVQKIIEMLKLI